MFVCEYGGLKLMSGIFPSCSPSIFFFLRQVLQLAHTTSSKVASQSLGPSGVCLSSIDITAMYCCARLFMWTLDVWIQFFIFAWQTLYQLIHPLFFFSFLFFKSSNNLYVEPRLQMMRLCAISIQRWDTSDLWPIPSSHCAHGWQRHPGQLVCCLTEHWNNLINKKYSATVRGLDGAREVIWAINPVNSHYPPTPLQTS